MCINHARCQASTGSIAFDVRDNLMLVFARWFYTNLQHNAALPPTGIYEHLLGIVRINPGPQSSAQAVRHIIEMACTRRKGRRNKDSFHGAEDVLDKDLLEHVKSSITSAVADGGPSEQSALAALPALDLPNVNMISRDRCHRSRGLMKAIWQPLNEMCCGLLGIFITDDKSISRMLRKLGLHVCLKLPTARSCWKSPCNSKALGKKWNSKQRLKNHLLRNSSKYSSLFKDAQMEEDNLGFWKAIRNLSFAGQRFDSLTSPLFKIFSLFPGVIRFLCNMTKVGDVDDQKWAKRILEALTAPSGGQHLIKAAMVADCLLTVQNFLRLDDRSDTSVIIKAREAICFRELSNKRCCCIGYSLEKP